MLTLVVMVSGWTGVTSGGSRQARTVLSLLASGGRAVCKALWMPVM